MFILQKPNQVLDVTLPSQKKLPEENRILWKVKALSDGDNLEYELELNRVCGLEGLEQRTALHALIRRVVVDWANVVDDKGVAVPLTDEALLLFPIELKLLIAHELPEAAGWGEARSKK